MTLSIALNDYKPIGIGWSIRGVSLQWFRSYFPILPQNRPNEQYTILPSHKTLSSLCVVVLKHKHSHLVIAFIFNRRIYINVLLEQILLK